MVDPQISAGLDPRAVGAAQDLIVKTHQAAQAMIEELNVEPQEAIEKALEHTLEELETFKVSGHNLHDPRIVGDMIKFVTRYKEGLK